MLRVGMWQQGSFLSVCGHIIFATDELLMQSAEATWNMLDLQHGKPT